MEEHIFGTFSTDELKLLYERTVARGIHHHACAEPPDPLPGEPFDLILTTGSDLAADEIQLFYSSTGEPADETSATLPFQPTVRNWSVAAWSYVTEWRARMPGIANDTLLRYRIAWRSRGAAWQWVDALNPQRIIEHTLVQGESSIYRAPMGVEQEFARSIDTFAPPQWAQVALIYQIVLDRFARGDGGPWDSSAPLASLHGGTLRGVTRALPYIADLGATCIWLSPLFPSPTYHGYDATSYHEVEPRLGTKADLTELVRQAHALGIRVILDFVCNHVSDRHPRFRKAVEEPQSPLREWFWFDPEHAPSGYRSFFGVSSMPELNTAVPAVRSYLVDAALMWLRDCDVDGFRLDYAHGPTHAFWAHFWRAVKETKSDAWCFGEVIDTPQAMRGYAGFLDGVLDFHLGEALRHVFATRSRDLAWFDRFLHDHDAYFPPHDRFSRPTFLDNHDMERFLFRAAGDSEAALRLASLVLYSLPNPPLIYYGTEIGLEQRYGKAEYGLEASREPMRWEPSASQRELLAWFQQLARLRAVEGAMRPTRRETLYVTADEYLGRHTRDQSEILFALNRATLNTTLHDDALRGTFLELLTGRSVELDGTLSLGPVQGQLLKPLTRTPVNSDETHH